VRAAARRLVAAPGGWPIHLLLAALLVPRASFLGEALFDRDLHGQWYPRALAFAQAARERLPPLWDTWIGFGQPWLADPSAQLLYPTTWLGAVLAPWTAYTLYAIGHLALAGAGMTRLARASGLRRTESLVAGVAFLLSGPFVSLVNLWHHLAGAAWLPWVVLAVHRLVRRPRPATAIRLGVCLALQVLAGSADMVLMTAAFSLAWVVGVARPARRPAPIAAAGAGAILLALLLSAGQWLPAVDVASHAIRRELPTELADRWSVPPAGLVRAVLPLDGSGRLAWTPATHLRLFDTTAEPLLGSFYLGIVPLALAGAGLASGRRRALTWALAAAAVAATLVAFGSHAPFAALVRALVPGASHLRYPSKAMLIPACACALLAGQGLAAVRRIARARTTAGVVALCGAAALAAGAVILGPALPWAFAWNLLADRPGARADALPWAVRFLVFALLALLASAVLLRSARRPPIAHWAALLLLCTTAELWLAHNDLHPTAPPELLTVRPPVLSALDTSGGGRTYVYDYALVEGAALRRLGRDPAYAVLQPPAGFDPRVRAALAVRLYPVPPVAATWGVQGSYDIDLTGLQPLPLWGLNLSLRHAEGTPAHASLLRLGAVRSVVALDAQGFADLLPGPRFPSLFPEPILTFQVPGALPRARIPSRARALEGREALAALFDPAFDPAAEVILSGPGAREAASAAQRTAGSVRITELRVDRVRLEAELDSGGVVVLADAWDDGWRAWVDGAPAPVLVANVAFRAVAVAAGRHVVEMRYRPRAALVGLALTGLSLLALAVVAVLVRLRRRSGRGGSL
jgi:Bacterial membrane protein YfhO